MIDRLALGTVQFGLQYGIANRTGQVSLDDAIAILAGARAAGVDTLDTAAAYGDSERRIGQAGAASWRIVSKLPPSLPGSTAEVSAWVDACIVDSLENLRAPCLYGLLVHSTDQLAGFAGRSLWRSLESARSRGLVKKIGMSIYDTNELDALWPTFRPDLIQAPFNVFDRRLEKSGWLARLHESGAEIHTRSAFLQGALLMPVTRRPQTFRAWTAHWARWDAWLASQSFSGVQACLGFVLSRPSISRVVVGVDSLAQLNEILDAAREGGMDAPIDLECPDQDLINPSRWRL